MREISEKWFELPWGNMLLIRDGIFIWMSGRWKEDYFLKWKGDLVVKNSDVPPWVRRITVKSKGHSAGADPRGPERRSSFWSPPQPVWGFRNAFTLRRGGSKGECLRRRQSMVVELTRFILPCANQDGMGYNLCKTLPGLKMLETVYNVAMLGRFKANVLYGS